MIGLPADRLFRDPLERQSNLLRHIMIQGFLRQIQVLLDRHLTGPQLLYPDIDRHTS